MTTKAGALAVGLMTLLVSVMACAYGKGAPYAVSGQLFRSKILPDIRKGMTREQVRSILGDPLAISTEGEIESWRYYVHERQDEHVYILGLIPTSRRVYDGEARALIEFRRGVVDRLEYALE
jgi:outer membrane protein assembly factor BamE (lipoprotein component of BamABCDE complex)